MRRYLLVAYTATNSTKSSHIYGSLEVDSDVFPSKEYLLAHINKTEGLFYPVITHIYEFKNKKDYDLWLNSNAA